MEEVEDDWNGAYEQFMLEFENKAEHDKVDTIVELLDMLLISNGLETSSSSSSRPPPVILKVQPMVQTPTSSEAPSSNAFDDVNLQRKFGAETGKWKVKRMAAKKVRAGLMAEQGAKLEKLERLLEDLESSKIDAGVLAGTHEKLRKLQDFVQEVISNMRPVPRIVLFYLLVQEIFLTTKLRTKSIKLLTNPGDRWGVRWTLLCEEPGHEHIVRSQKRIGTVDDHYVNRPMGGGLDLKKFQPLIDSGLQVVRVALSRATQVTNLEAVTLSILGEKPWDLRAIDLEKHDIQTKLASEDEEIVELQKKAENIAAESLLSYLEENDISIFDRFGLLCVRYTTTDRSDCPRFKQGTVAWLCTEHHDRGLEAGILEPYPFRMYHSLEHDQQRGFLLVHCPSYRISASFKVPSILVTL